MTMSLVALCADSTSLQHPETIGLAGENLAAQEWLRLFSSAEEIRRFLRQDQLVDEVWVASSDDVAPINLAATLKRDRSDRSVCMLAFQETGSLKSRVSATGIDASLTRQAFVERYARRKQQGVRGSAFAYPSGEGTLHNQGFPPRSFAVDEPVKFMSNAGVSGDQSHRAPTRGAAVRAAVAASSSAKPSASSFCATASMTPLAHSGSAFLMPVVSGSGGAGKSTISVLAALLAQRLGYNTLLLDFDLQFGDAPVLLGEENPLTLDEVLHTPARLERLRSADSRPALIAAPRHLEQAEFVVEHASELLDQVMGSFDFIVANTGGAWAEQHAVLLERSTKALFLVDQRPSSVRACRHALDLCARCGIATKPFLFAVNRCTKGAPLTSIDVSCALRGAHVSELKDGGRDVEELLGAGLYSDLLESRNDLCSSLESLLLDVLPRSRERACAPVEDERGLGFHLFKNRNPRSRKRGVACL